MGLLQRFNFDPTIPLLSIISRQSAVAIVKYLFYRLKVVLRIFHYGGESRNRKKIDLAIPTL